MIVGYPLEADYLAAPNAHQELSREAQRRHTAQNFPHDEPIREHQDRKPVNGALMTVDNRSRTALPRSGARARKPLSRPRT